eukprot:SAG22_NODE_3407_length_1731_cov_1.334559_1_plen_108_part_00
MLKALRCIVLSIGVYRTVATLKSPVGCVGCDWARDLGNNQITDIAPLSALTALTSLGLHSNQITDIAMLSALTSLKGLWIFNNPGNFSNSDRTVGLLKSRGCTVRHC